MPLGASQRRKRRADEAARHHHSHVFDCDCRCSSPVRNRDPPHGKTTPTPQHGSRAARCPSRVVGHRAKIWLATVSTVVGVATGMPRCATRCSPARRLGGGECPRPRTSSTSAASATRSTPTTACGRTRTRSSEAAWSGAKTTLTQRNALLDPVRRRWPATATRWRRSAGSSRRRRSPPSAATPSWPGTATWRESHDAVRLDRGRRRVLRSSAAVDHLSTLRPLLAADGVRLACGAPAPGRRRMRPARADGHPGDHTAVRTRAGEHRGRSGARINARTALTPPDVSPGVPGAPCRAPRRRQSRPRAEAADRRCTARQVQGQHAGSQAAVRG